MTHARFVSSGCRCHVCTRDRRIHGRDFPHTTQRRIIRGAVEMLGGLTASEYARALGFAPSSTISALTRLQKRGHVTRVEGGGPRGGDTWFAPLPYDLVVY